MTEDRKRSARVYLLLIAAVFFGPLLLAAWLYYSGYFVQPDSRANNGTLLEPIVNLEDRLPASPLHDVRDDKWQLLYEFSGPCEDDCRNGLYTIRQVRLMLGREMDRVGRIFLHDDSPLDTLFLDSEHQGLTTLEEPALKAFLHSKTPAELDEGGYYLIDPQGNLVLYFEPGLNPRDVVDDIKRLLRLSRIG